MPASHFDVNSMTGRPKFIVRHSTIGDKIWCDQLKNKSSRRVTYGNPRYSIGSKANSIYFLNDRSVLLGTKYFGRHSSVTSKQINVNQALTSSQ
jgi:hypothetical protein